MPGLLAELVTTARWTGPRIAGKHQRLGGSPQQVVELEQERGHDGSPLGEVLVAFTLADFADDCMEKCLHLRRDF